MSVTKEFLEYLDTEVGIAPAGSQEELDCAQSLAGVFSAHGLEPEVQDFTAPSLGYLPYGVVMAVLFLGVVLVGVGSAILTFVGFVLVAAAVALLVMTYTGQDVISKASPRTHSQNVVAFHAAEGEDSSRNRPIVVVAHYDTQRLDLLSRPEVAVAKKYIAKAAPYLVIAVAVCTFIQILVFLPAGVRRTFWVLGIIASLPVLAWGVTLIAAKFLPYAAGGVDNKSSLAAMLGVMERVSPTGYKPHRPAKDEEQKEAPESVHDSVVRPARREPVMREVVEEVVGTRHGEEVIRELGILPVSCDITYIAPEVKMVQVFEPEPEPVEVEESPAAQTVELEAQPAENDIWASTAVPASEVAATADAPADVADGPDPAATAAMEPVSEEAADEVADPGATQPMAPVSAAPRIDASLGADPATLTQLEDGERTDEGPLVENDHSGITTMAEESDEEAAQADRPERPRPSAVEDPEWGRSSYAPKQHPTVGNVARRAALFDLPDPLQADVDPLAPEQPVAQQLPPKSQMAQRLADASAQAVSAPAPVRLDNAAGQYSVVNQSAYAASDDIQVREAPVAQSNAQDAKKHGLGGLFGKKRRQQQESMSEWLGVDEGFNAKESGEAMGSWDNFNNDDMNHHGSGWKGGAALNVNLRGLKDKVAGLRPGAENGAAAEAPASEGAPEPGVTNAMNADEVAAQAQATAEGDASAYVPDAYDPNAPVAQAADNAASDDANGIGTISAAVGDHSLRDAILAMADDDLRAHDIWFVATGASAFDHAGIKSFVEQNRKKLRGAFVINLECVGAGDLTMLTSEGFGRPRRADRRVTGLLGKVSNDLHINLGKLDRPWADTDATPLMRKHLRGVTLMGLGAGELPAFAHTANDVPENVDAEQVEDVCALIMEAIRRS